MAPTRRRLLAAAASSVIIAGCAGDGDGTATPGAGDGGDGGGGDGGGGDADTPTATPTDGSTPTGTPTDTPTATPTGTPEGVSVQVGSHPELGEILVDGDGRTLYMFDADTQGEGASACTGNCVTAWPPLTVEGELTAGDGVTAELTTFEREDGSTQVAAGGWPLYYFADDSSPGDANGQGANGVWWVLRPDGTPVRPSSTQTPTPAPATVQVGSHPELGDVLVDGDGRTLYMFDADTQGEGASACTGNCAGTWPPLTVDGEPAAGDGVTAALTTFEREDGSTQVAAGGWPLYYFADDSSPGDANGQGANGVWWVLDPVGQPIRGGSTPTAAPTDAPTATPTETPTSTPTPTDEGGIGY